MEFITQQLCMGKDLGVHGNLFGGVMMSWVDEAAGTMASKVCRSPYMVTLKIDEVIFKKPVKVGFMIRIYGKVQRIGNTSITIQIEARRYNVISEDESVVLSTKITFVRLDESGDPVPIPSVVKEKYKLESNE